MADEQNNHKQHQTETMNFEEPTSAPAPPESTDRGLFDHFGKKKEEDKHQEEVINTEFHEKLQVSDGDHEKCQEEKNKDEKHGSLLEKFHRDDDSSSSSSSSDEDGVDEEKKKKRKEKKEKKGLKEKIKEKLPGGQKKEEEEKKHMEEDTTVSIETCHDRHDEKEKIHDQETVYSETSQPEEKRGFLGKIKDKLPGQKKSEEEKFVAASAAGHDHGHKKTEDVTDYSTPVAAPADHHVAPAVKEGETVEYEKKGFFDKIKEKIPGFHSKTEEEKAREIEKEVAKEKEKEEKKECGSTYA